MDARRIGHAALHGWKGRVGERAAPQIAGRTRWSEDQVRAAIGLVLFALSLRYVLKTVRNLART